MMSPHSAAPGPVPLFDRSTRLRMQFTGAKAAESLTGLVTNDVLALRGGDGLYACALTAKGRIIADVRILAIAGADGAGVGSYLVDANAAAGSGFAAMIRKYVNPRLATYTDVSSETRCLTLAGDRALALLRQVAGDASSLDALEAGAAFTHVRATVGDADVRVVRAPDLGPRSTVDLIGDAAAVDAAGAALRAAGAVDGGEIEWHRLRVMAARPEWGVDMDENTLAQEANMDALQAISYRKGCYTGQETVARVHFRGHVNRTLRRVAYPGALPAHGTELRDADGAAVGVSRSVALDDGGTGIGIAMLRREVQRDARLAWSDAAGATHAARVTDDAAAD
ncbi:MAG: hypothetical protein IT355_12565 [Gemmatimonadaceae bacterium]|nr:hypothetical protein [Gemmatimonadaceae bacterium]